MKGQLNHSKDRTYVCSYNYYGKPYSIEIQAESFEEAEKRLRSIGFNGKVDGELVTKVPVLVGQTWLQKLISIFNRSL